MYYTIDGLTPSTSSSQYYTGTRISISGSTVYNMTVKAICTLNNATSLVISQVYQVVSNTTQVPIFRPVVSIHRERIPPLIVPSAMRLSRSTAQRITLSVTILWMGKIPIRLSRGQKLDLGLET